MPVERRDPSRLPGLLKATWVSEGYRDDAQERDAFRRAVGWLEDYVAGLDPADEPIGVERVVPRARRRSPFRAGSTASTSAATELVIVDYKTGRSEPTGDDARGSRALALYAFAAERVFRRRCRQVELHHLPTGTVAAHEHTEESLGRHLRRAEGTARDIVAAEAAVAGGAAPDEVFAPAPGPWCSWCDFKKSCPAGAEALTREPWAAVERPAQTGD